METKCGNAGKHYLFKCSTNMPQLDQTEYYYKLLIKRDLFKRKAIKTNEENYWKLYKSARNSNKLSLFTNHGLSLRFAGPVQYVFYNMPVIGNLLGFTNLLSFWQFDALFSDL